MDKIKEFLCNHKEGVCVAIFILCTSAFVLFTTYSCVHDIKEIGGFRTLIVESGKEVKLIANDINEAVEEHYESERDDPYR